ncbi:MAG: type II toxin-antitoxin system VapC family toxin [Bacteroidota bacterium]
MERLVVCLDTSILIDYFRKKDKTNSLLYQLSAKDYEFSITSITEFKLRRGISKRQEDFWNKLLASIEVLAFTSQSAKLASEIDNKLKKKNKQVNLADLFIAAIALNHDLPIATLNKKHFDRIPGLNSVSL